MLNQESWPESCWHLSVVLPTRFSILHSSFIISHETPPSHCPGLRPLLRRAGLRFRGPAGAVVFSDSRADRGGEDEHPRRDLLCPVRADLRVAPQRAADAVGPCGRVDAHAGRVRLRDWARRLPRRAVAGPGAAEETGHRDGAAGPG